MAKRIHKSSKYKGVTWDKQFGQWRAQVRCDGTVRKLGRFNSEFDAALQHDLFVVAHNIEGARLNFSRDELILWAQKGTGLPAFQSVPALDNAAPVSANNTEPKSETDAAEETAQEDAAQEREAREDTGNPEQVLVEQAPAEQAEPEEPETLAQMLSRMLGQDSATAAASHEPSTDTRDH